MTYKKSGIEYARNQLCEWLEENKESSENALEGAESVGDKEMAEHLDGRAEYYRKKLEEIRNER